MAMTRENTSSYRVRQLQFVEVLPRDGDSVQKFPIIQVLYEIRPKIGPLKQAFSPHKVIC